MPCDTTELDMTPRYAPLQTIVYGRDGAYGEPVEQYLVHPVGAHPANCPIASGWTVLEMRTRHGKRWFGCSRAYINSELRMVVVGTNPRDEVRMKWPVCTEA